MNQIEENKQLYAQGAASQVSSDPTLSSAATSANKETYKAATPNAQLFTSYFMSTHGQDGHMTGDAPSLSINEQLEMWNYEAQRVQEQEWRDSGVSDKDIALFRAWDTDLNAARFSGQKVNFNQMSSAQYAENAFGRFQYDEMMYTKYVASARHFAQQEYDPDGDNHWNWTENMLDEMGNYNEEELANTYDWLDPDAKRMLNFDGIHNRNDFARYARSAKATLDAKRQEEENDHIGNFFKGLAHSFVSAVMDFPKIFTTVISAGAALFSGGWDNSVSRAMGDANKAIDSVTEDWDDVIGLTEYNKKDGWFKAGSFIGTAVEMGAEIATGTVIGKGVGLAAKGMEKVAIRQTEKAAAKGITHVAESQAAKQLQRSGARAIEREATAMSRQWVTEGAADAVKAGLLKKTTSAGLKKESYSLTEKGMKHILDAHLEKMGGKELSKLSVAALEHSLETATIRLAKRGLYEYAKKGVLDGALKAGGKYVAGKMAKKGAKEVVEAGAKQVAKTGAKKTFAGQTAKMTKGMVKSAVERAKGKFAINTMVRKGAAPEILSASIKRAGSLPSRLARPLFGKTDPITKLFALKSFSSVVQQGQANGLSPINSILRGTLAAGTTNAIWGSTRLGGANGITRLFQRDAASTAEDGILKMFQHEGVSFAKSFMKMKADGTLQSIISDGFRSKEDERGEKHFQWGIWSNIKKEMSGENLLDTFWNVLALHGVAGANRQLKRAYGFASPRVQKNARRKTNQTIHDALSGGGDLPKSITGATGAIAARYNEIYEGIKHDNEVNGKKMSAEDMVDAAVAEMWKDGYDTAQFVENIYLQSKAFAYGAEVRMKFDEVQRDQDKKYEEMLSLLEVEGGAEKMGSYKAYTAAVQVALMEGVGDWEGAIPRDELEGRPNWSPQEIHVGAAIFMNEHPNAHEYSHKDLVKYVKESINKGIEIKKMMGEKSFNNMMKVIEPEKLHEFVNRYILTRDSMDRRTKEWLAMKSEIKSIKHKKGTQKWYDSAIEILDRYDMTEEKSDELNSNGFGNEQESVNLRKKETAKSVKASPEEIVNKLVKSVDNAEVGEKASVIDGKLKLLSDLRNEGKISPQEYRQAAERILNHPDFKNHIKNDPVLAEKARLFTRGLNIKDKAESLGRFITGGGQGFSYGDMTSWLEAGRSSGGILSKMANLESKIKALTDNRKHIAEADPAVYKEVTGRNLEEDLKDIDTAASGFKKLKAGFEKEKTQMSDNEYKKFEAADEVRKRNTDVMKETKLDNKFEKVELKLEAIEPDPADPEFEKYEDYKRRYDEIKLELESQAKNDTEGSTEAPGLHEKIRKLADDIQKDINHDLKLKNKLKIPKKRSVKTTKGKSSEKVESDMEVCKR